MSCTAIERERGTCTSPRADSDAGPGGVSVGEPGEDVRAGELALFLAAGLGGLAEAVLENSQGGEDGGQLEVWLTQPPPRPRTSIMSWPTPSSTSSMNCWSK